MRCLGNPLFLCKGSVKLDGNALQRARRRAILKAEKGWRGWKLMNILVIDAQGGGIGRQLVAELLRRMPSAEITAVGTNSAATAAMLKAGAHHAATGENAVVVGCRRADVIVGPIGIVIADSLWGEVTPKMAVAVGQSSAQRVLIPINHCDNRIAGLQDVTVGQLVVQAVDMIESM